MFAGAIIGQLIILGILYLTPGTPAPIVRQPAFPSQIVASTYAIGVSEIAAPFDPGNGGAIEAVDGRLLLGTRLGTFHWLDTARGVGFDPLPIAAPFDAEAIRNSPQPARTGLRDLIARKNGAQIDLTVSFTTYEPDRDCFIMRVASTQLHAADLTQAEPKSWRRIYEANRCVASTTSGLIHEAGGALGVARDGRLMLTIGPFGLDGNSAQPAPFEPQVPTSDLGKVIAIDPSTGEREIVSMGHRNADGLVVSSAGDIWTVEHGPRGGDELNLVRPGDNFGWPYESYGADYGGFSLATDDTPGDHARFKKPVMAWVPSLAVTDIEQLKGDEFPQWRGDLIVASLRAGQLNRLRTSEGRVVVDEAIRLGARIRDIAIDDDGEIYAKLDTLPIVLRLSNASGGTEAAGLDFCVSCHAISPSDAGEDKAGPTLHGVVGRPIGGVEGYEYSLALQRKEGVWTEENLIRFLLDPSGFAPGTSMPGATLQKWEAEKIARILAGSE